MCSHWWPKVSHEVAKEQLNGQVNDGVTLNFKTYSHLFQLLNNVTIPGHVCCWDDDNLFPQTPKKGKKSKRGEIWSVFCEN